MEPPGLLRFSHCGLTVVLPRQPVLRCPLCGAVPRLGLLSAPVALRPPFTDGHLSKLCFVLSSASGVAALREDNNSELHVGISNSKGVVFSYTEAGMQQQQCGWELSIVVPLVSPSDLSVTFMEHWDGQLEAFAADGAWTGDRFQEQREFGSCCYGFALGFINHMRRLEGKQPISGEYFTGQHVLPRLNSASRYLSICEHVRLHGYYTCEDG